MADTTVNDEGGLTTGAVLGLEITASLAEGSTFCTPINLAQHSYFNLDCHDASHGILAHVIAIPAEAYLPTTDECLPTGEIKEGA